MNSWDICSRCGTVASELDGHLWCDTCKQKLYKTEIDIPGPTPVRCAHCNEPMIRRVYDMWECLGCDREVRP